MGFSSARNLGRDISAGFSPPRRMPISEAVKKFMRVPKGAGNSVPWDPELTPYIIEPMNCLASREYDAVIFVGPARTGKTIGLIDGWIVYTIVCDPSDMLVVQMTEDKAREHSKKRLDRTFRSSAAVARGNLRIQASTIPGKPHDSSRHPSVPNLSGPERPTAAHRVWKLPVKSAVRDS